MTRLIAPLLLALFTLSAHAGEPPLEAPAPSLADKAFAIAQGVAATMPKSVERGCLTEGSFFGFQLASHDEDQVQGFNIAFGEVDPELGCQGDPHFSIEVFFDKDGQFIMATLIDA